MDGEPLPRPHGAPRAVVITDMFGYKNVTWVRRIEADPPIESRATWERNGTTVNAWVGFERLLMRVGLRTRVTPQQTSGSDRPVHPRPSEQ